MSEASAPRSTRRILVAIDTSPLAPLAVELAAQLASELRSELEGVFYEDAQLLRLSGLSFVRESSYTSAAGRPLSPALMQRRLRARQDEIRSSLAQQCAQLRLSWSLTTVREPAARHAVQSRRDADLLVIGVETRQPRATVEWHHRDRSGRRVIVLFDGTAAGRQALASGLRAAQRGWQLIVLPAGESDEEARQLRRQAMQESPPHAEVLFERAESAADVLRVVRLRRGDLLIAPWQLSIADESSLQQIVDELDCIVMLVR